MADEPPFDPAAPFAVLPAWWLEVICRCGRMRQIPIRLLIEQHGPRARATALVGRMRCNWCGSRPASAEWIDSPQGGAFGSDYPPPQRVPVVRPSG